MFKKCPSCGTVWSNREEFLSDPGLTLCGYQVNFIDLELGFFLFNHSCGTTLAIEANLFVDLYDGPVFKKHLRGTQSCPEYCLHTHELRRCPAECECAYVREILQTILAWPKAP